MFETAKKMVQGDLDIRSIQKQILKLKFITSILLSKNQRQLFPYFKECLINTKTPITDIKQDGPDNLALSVNQCVSNLGVSKIDKRIIKNITDQDKF